MSDKSDAMSDNEQGKLGAADVAQDIAREIREREADALKTRFLEQYRELGSVERACKATGISRARHNRWLELDIEYAIAFEDAIQDAADAMEREADRRAIQGVEKPVFYKGQVCGSITEYSDTLLIFRLKALRPDMYRERLSHEFTSVPTEELAERAQRLVDRIRASGAAASAESDED